MESLLCNPCIYLIFFTRSSVNIPDIQWCYLEYCLTHFALVPNATLPYLSLVLIHYTLVSLIVFRLTKLYCT